MTHRDGFPRFSARSAWRSDQGIESHAPRLKAMGRPQALGSRLRPGGRTPEGVGKPCRCPAGPAASLLPARWPDASPARSLWVIISAPWY